MKPCTKILWIILVCAQIPVNSTQYNEFVVRDNGTEGREIIIVQTGPPNILKITCFGYDSLVNLNVDDRFENFKPYAFLDIQFINCFNNATDHANYQEVSLDNMLRQLRMNLSRVIGIEIKNHEYGLVDPEIFLHNFDFIKYRHFMFRNIGHVNATYLQEVQCCYLTVENSSAISFTNFAISSLVMVHLIGANILNFTKNNLAKFPELANIQFLNFSLDDPNALNVSNLFGHNTQLTVIQLRNSRDTIILHEDVFLGLHNLRTIWLNSLKLEIIPKNLFRDLRALNEVELKNNNVKILDPDTFANIIDLQALYIGMDEFLYSDEFRHLKLKDNTIVGFNDANIKDLKMLTSILQNMNLKQVQFCGSSSLWNIDLLDLVRHNITRSTRLNIKLIDIPFRMNFSQLLNRKIVTELSFEQYDQLNTLVTITIANSASSTVRCVFNQEFFLWYLDNNVNSFTVYYEEYNAALMLKVYIKTVELNYQFPFYENCPKMCKCYHNPLLDGITIDCTKQDLKLIPIIPYPTQFVPIDTIELNLGHNLLTDIQFDAQDDRVLQKLYKVEFHNNPIVRVELTEKMQQTIHTVRCPTPNLMGLRNSEISVSIDDGNSTIITNHNLCAVKAKVRKNTNQYLRARPTQEIIDVLDSCSTDSLTTCSMNIIDNFKN